MEMFPRYLIFTDNIVYVNIHWCKTHVYPDKFNKVESKGDDGNVGHNTQSQKKKRKER